MITEKKADALYETDNAVIREYLNIRYNAKANPYEPFNDMARRAHDVAVSKGWWESDNDSLFPEKCMMVVAEIAKALDEYRNMRAAFYFTPSSAPTGQAARTCFNRAEWHGEKISGVHVELVDALIRLLDLMSALNVDIDEVVSMKMAYNTQWEYRHGNKKA